MAKNREIIYVGAGRFVAALDAGTGEELWRTKLGGANCVVTLLLKGQSVFAGYRGRMHCLDARTGTLRWENDLPKMGYGAVLCAMEGAWGCSPQGAVAAHEAAQASDASAAAAAGAAAS